MEHEAEIPAIRKATWILALFLLAGMVGASRLPLFRDAEGFITAQFCLLPTVSLVLLLVTASWHSPLRRSAGWFGLLLIGQGLGLQLVDAGTSIHYQHYRAIGELSTAWNRLLAGLLVVQTLVVSVGLRNRIRPILAWARNQLGVWRALAVSLTAVVLSIFPSSEPGRFAVELLMSGVFVATQLGCLLLGMMSIPRETAGRWAIRLNSFIAGPVTGWSTPSRAGIDRLVLLCAVWTTCIAAALASFSYERHPHIPDEVAYIFHADYFARGQLSINAPPVPEATQTYLIDCESGRCFSTVPPGWPAVLAIGALLGTEWLVNPVLAGINVLLLFLLLRQLYDRYTARLGVLVVAASPWHLLMSMNFMTHTFSLTCALLAAVSVVRMHHSHQSSWGIMGGAAIGLLSLTRPLEGLMVATVLGLAALAIPGKRFRLGPVVMLGLASVAVGAVILPYNAALTGDPTSFPIMAYTDKALGAGVNALGFGPDKGVSWGGLDPFPGHGLPDVLVNAYVNLSAMNIEMFGWSIGSLLLIILLLGSRPATGFETSDLWMLFFVLVIFGYQSLYWFSGGPDFGARYYYLAVIPMTALTVQALQRLSRSTPPEGTTSHRVSGRVLAGVLVLCTGALTGFLPWRAVDKYHHYRGMRPDIGTLVADMVGQRNLLLIAGEPHPDLNSAIVYSSLDPYADEPVVAWDRDETVRNRVLRAYRDRKVWLIDGPSRTGDGYRITAGPLDATDLLR